MRRQLALVLCLALSLSACASEPDPSVGEADSGASDANTADSGASDADTSDTGAADTGPTDTGASDTGVADADDTSGPGDAADAADVAADAGADTTADAPDLGVRYYVSPAGDDANAGTSPELAWRTIDRANQAALEPGVQVLFEGGQSFAGTLTFDADDGGTPSEPIVVGTYGDGRATLDAGDAGGIVVYNTAGVEIAGLDVVGSGRASNGADGVLAYVDLGGDTKLEHLVFDDLDVHGFGKTGISVGANNGNSGFRGVRVTRTRSHDNAVAGIQVYGAWSSTPTGYAMEDVYIGHCVVHGNTGIAGQSHHTGNGIVIGGVDGGVIERSVAYDNGRLNDAVGGPIGIWAWDSNDVTIQYNEAYANRTRSSADGGGFDLDGGVTNSVMQYNYSHDNDGAGFLLAQFSGAARPFANNVVRYNISQNDGRKNGYAGIDFWTASSENADNPIRDISVYGNTVFVSPSATGSPSALRFIEGTRTVDVQVHNNLFVTTGGAHLAKIPTGQEGLVIQHNAYWASGDAFRIRHHGTTYDGLQAWRDGSGHEMRGAVAVGVAADPLLTAPGAGPTLGDAGLLDTMQAYQVASTSPVIDAGLDLGWSAAVTDFWGTAVPLGGAPDIGAHEAR